MSYGVSCQSILGKICCITTARHCIIIRVMPQWASWQLKSPAAWLFIQQVMPVMQKVFPCPDMIMYFCCHAHMKSCYIGPILNWWWLVGAFDIWDLICGEFNGIDFIHSHKVPCWSWSKKSDSYLWGLELKVRWIITVKTNVAAQSTV